MNGEMLFTAANVLLGKTEALRDAMASDGFLFFRALIDRNHLRNVRQDILSLCRRAGWLRDGTALEDGIANLERTCREPQPEYMAVYNEVMKLESFHAFAHDPALLDMLHDLIGEDVLVHPRNIARIIFPQNVRYTTPAHQDWIHVQGTPQTYSAWIPLGDCPQALGSLTVLAGSHRHGIYATHRADGAGGRAVDTSDLPLSWACFDFREGDVLLFHSHTVHKALPNLDSQQLRLSVDYRYQGVSQPITEGSLLPHFAQVSWEEVYRGWQRTDLQYYWKKHELNLVPFVPDHPGRIDGTPPLRLPGLKETATP